MYFSEILRKTLLFFSFVCLSSLFFTTMGISSILVTFSVIAFVLFLYLLTYIKKTKISPLIQGIVYTSIFWCVIRLTVLCFFPEKINYQYLIEFADYDVALSICLTMLSTLFLVVGVLLSSKIRTFRFKLTVPSINLRLLNFYFAIIILFHFGIEFFSPLDVSLIESNVILQFIVAPDSVFIVFMAVNLSAYNQDRLARFSLLFFCLLCGYIVLRVLQGSKSGGYTLVYVFLLAQMVIHRDPFFSKKTLISILCVILPVMFIAFYSGHVTRFFKAMNQTQEFSLSVSEVKSFLDDDKISLMKISNPSEFLHLVSRRVSMFEYLNVMFTKKPEEKDYLTVGYGLKTVWNIVAPRGELEYEDAKLFPANLFKAAYSDRWTYEEAQQNYHTDMLPLYGYLYVNLGVGSFLLLTYIGFVVGILFTSIYHRDLSTLLAIKVLFIWFVFDFIWGMGFGSVIQQFLFFTLIPFLSFFSYQALVQATKKVLIRTR